MTSNEHPKLSATRPTVRNELNEVQLARQF